MNTEGPESNPITFTNKCTTVAQCLVYMLWHFIQLFWFDSISVKSYLVPSQCARVYVCTFHKSSVTYTGTLETAKTFQRCCSPTPHHRFRHMLFFIFQTLICALSWGLGALFPSLFLAHQQHTDKTTNTSDSHRLYVKVHHGSARLQWAKATITAAAAAGTDWLHRVRSLGLFL